MVCSAADAESDFDFCSDRVCSAWCPSFQQPFCEPFCLEARASRLRSTCAVRRQHSCSRRSSSVASHQRLVFW
eukprot:3264040-Pleurochrysis_carterae.AAC.3